MPYLLHVRRSKMTTRRHGFIGVAVTAVLVCWAGTALAAPGGLPQCQADLNTCNANLATCTAERDTCTADLATCNANLAAAQQFPATGQTTCSDGTGVEIPCSGTGQDGDIQAGATLSYTDNDDGTITDNNTKLMWEKKSGPADLSIHSVSVVYTWNNAFAVHVAALNNATLGCFAGHCDWRVPNVKELQSIVNYENAHPAVSPAFNNGDCTATSMCTVTECSCTAASNYWTSTSSTDAPFPNVAWAVIFSDGGVNASGTKGSSRGVRAVRGGSNLGPQQ